MIIDGHVHITDNGSWLNNGPITTLSELMKATDKAHVDKAAMLSPVGMTANETVVRGVGAQSNRLIGFGHLSSAPYRESVWRVKERGLTGVKFHPRLESRPLASLETQGLLEELAVNHLPLLVCGWLQSTSVVMDELPPLPLDRIGEWHPSVTFILAHLGGRHLWDVFFCARSNANVYLDCYHAPFF